MYIWYSSGFIIILVHLLHALSCIHLRTPDWGRKYLRHSLFFFKYSTVLICILIWFVGWVVQLSSSSLRIFSCLLMCECTDSSSSAHTKQTKWILFLSSTNKYSCNWLFKRTMFVFSVAQSLLLAKFCSLIDAFTILNFHYSKMTIH